MASTVPTSCIQVESTVLPAPIAAVWKVFRPFKLEDLAPEQVTSTVATTGEAGQVASNILISYANGGVWEIRITEISDRNYTLAYEVIGSEPAMTCTSVEGELAFIKVSDSDETFLKWTTIFSNDADAQVVEDQKYKKLDFFKEFKKTVPAWAQM
eukprot:CAMPEP_0194049516 /NCGR_PEP_ID=MMETSP0009_2-20130614/30727_1 /TAXON_ID=210454 /ORGANISM="Grammatophora oceanica, Strain CCMP 410" /LENGTH=154 /DNA_ID=CAMNT_0038695695 /DNA_START=54 /DNA_END=518 /DNA_ORIENTATION=-